ncbi:MAG: site-specific DNA-methyltransferase [Ruminococcaceae bacterium]|nr:site-specific DNA-methyltransferase [Oscillospiraceae bacterium]
MNIVFEGKETYKEIVERADKIDKQIDFGNRSFIIQGDNFAAMAAMLPQYKGKIDLVYIDPPFNTDQIFSVSESRTNTVSRPNKGEVAYSDVMTKDAFLKFMYDRFVLIRELLSDKGSLYVHIDMKMGHYFKVMLDEIFGDMCFKNDITRIKSNPKNFGRRAFGNQKDVIFFYSKTKANIWNDIRVPYSEKESIQRFSKIDETGRRYTTVPLHAPGETSPNSPTGKPWRGMNPPQGRHWRTDPAEFDRLDSIGQIEWSRTGNPRIKKYADEHQGKKIQDVWEYKDPQYPIYPTEKNFEMLELIVKQSSEEGSFVMDCFAGSGSTLLAAHKNNRRFIGIDDSSFSVKTIKNRMENTDFAFLRLSDNTLE